MHHFLEFPYYDLPLSNEVLPLPLVDPGAYFAAGFEKDGLDIFTVSKDGKLFVTSYPDIYSFALWASISRYFAVLGINQAAEVPFQAVAQDDGTPGANEPQPVSVYGSSNGDGFMMLWLGCRCSWPVTQLMWYQALGCQLHAWAAVVVAVLTLILQIMLLDGFLSQMVGQAPHLPRKLSIKAEEDLLGYSWQLMEVIVVPLLILIFVVATGFGLNWPHAWNLLMTLANRYEGQTYAYFTVAFWSVILTIKNSILFAYVTLLYPLFIVSGASGNVLQDAIDVLIIYTAFETFPGLALKFVMFVGCFGHFTPESPLPGLVNMYVVGMRQPVLSRATEYVSLWWQLGVGVLLIYILPESS
mmetsp:Transcript_45854/g.143487  ORF Transcript_45854/g.143487 Transcript_45854/m.143487 type:complete len:357 (+) Transcript_45854:124-1194(+)